MVAFVWFVWFVDKYSATAIAALAQTKWAGADTGPSLWLGGVSPPQICKPQAWSWPAADLPLRGSFSSS
jgi:hypothetical protein